MRRTGTVRVVATFAVAATFAVGAAARAEAAEPPASPVAPPAPDGAAVVRAMPARHEVAHPVRMDAAAVATVVPSGPDVRFAADGPPPPPSTDAPPVRVYGDRPAAPPTIGQPSYHPPQYVSENTPVGPNGQPEWTTARRFATTRAYVMAPWQVEFESWWRGTYEPDDQEQHRYLEEIGIGLPHRFQLDLYWRIQSETGEETRTGDYQVELRWALAPWDRLPLNPTLYFEYKFIEEPSSDVFEAKLLFADDLACDVHWAANLIWEEETDGEEERELAVSAGVGWTIRDSRFSVGFEALYANVSVEGARDDPEHELLLGPSVQVRIGRRVHLDVVPLFGLTEESPDVQIFVVLGIELFAGRQGPSSYAPTATRGW